MSKKTIRTAVVAVAVAGAGLALGLGAGLASADTESSVTAPDGTYLLIRTTVAAPLPTGVDVATVVDGKVIIRGHTLPGVTAERVDLNDDGRVDSHDPILAMKGDYSIGELRR